MARMPMPGTWSRDGFGFQTSACPWTIETWSFLCRWPTYPTSMHPMKFLSLSSRLTTRSMPDQICITGDFITTGLPATRIYRSILEKLSNTAATFAVMGNHDGGSWAHPRGGLHSTREVGALLLDSGIEVLNTRSTSWTGEVHRATWVGLGDLWAKESEPVFAFGGVTETPDPVIVLSHNPDSKETLRNYS